MDGWNTIGIVFRFLKSNGLKTQGCFREGFCRSPKTEGGNTSSRCGGLPCGVKTPSVVQSQHGKQKTPFARSWWSFFKHVPSCPKLSPVYLGPKDFGWSLWKKKCHEKTIQLEFSGPLDSSKRQGLAVQLLRKPCLSPKLKKLVTSNISFVLFFLGPKT